MNTTTYKKNVSTRDTITNTYPALPTNKERTSALRRAVGSWRNARVQEITANLQAQRNRDE
jgi:hypothetical protein